MVSNEQKALKKRTTWYTEICTLQKASVYERLLKLTASFALVVEGYTHLQLLYTYFNLTHGETSMAKIA